MFQTVSILIFCSIDTQALAVLSRSPALLQCPHSLASPCGIGIVSKWEIPVLSQHCCGLCCVCALNKIFPLNGFRWRTGDEVGTFVLRLLTESWVGESVYGIDACILLCFSPLLFILFSPNRRVGLCDARGLWNILKEEETKKNRHQNQMGAPLKTKVCSNVTRQNTQNQQRKVQFRGTCTRTWVFLFEAIVYMYSTWWLHLFRQLSSVKSQVITHTTCSNPVKYDALVFKPNSSQKKAKISSTSSKLQWLLNCTLYFYSTTF